MTEDAVWLPGSPFFGSHKKSKAISASLDVHQHWPLTLALCGIALAEESTFSPSVVSYNAMLSALERGILDDPSVFWRDGDV